MSLLDITCFFLEEKRERVVDFDVRGTVRSKESLFPSNQYLLRFHHTKIESHKLSGHCP